jgi:hypothetical protein
MLTTYKYKGSGKKKFSDWIVTIRKKNITIDAKIIEINTGLQGEYKIMNDKVQIKALDNTHEGIFRILVNPAVDSSVLELLNQIFVKTNDPQDKTVDNTQLTKAIDFINQNTGNIQKINVELQSILT